MRYWIYCEPWASETVYSIVSDKAILASYWEYWCAQMDKVDRAAMISEEHCIEDWVVVNWATEVTSEILQQFLPAPNHNNSAT